MNFKELTFKQILLIGAISIGGIIAITSPEHMNDAMDNTIWAVVLIAFFID